MSDRLDPIELVELAYLPRASVRDWMRAMAGPISRCLDADAAPAFAYCLGPGGPEDVVSSAAARSEPEAAAELRRAFDHFSEHERRVIADALELPGLASWLEIAGRPPAAAFGQDGSYKDVSIVVVHGTGRCPALFETRHQQPHRADPAQRALWRQLAVHLGAGCRLSVRAPSADATDVELVVAPDARVMAARGAACDAQAREGVRRAVADMDRARTRKGRSNAQAALELWQGFFAGRWSLVDHFDSDGRRFLLGRRTGPATLGRTLPRRQREVLYYVAAGWSNKEVGYAMGIGAATVAGHLHRALAALRIDSRSEWIRISAEVGAAALDALKPAA